MKEYTTTLYDRDSVKIVRFAIYHPQVLHEPFHVQFDVYFGPKKVASCKTLGEAKIKAGVREGVGA